MKLLTFSHATLICPGKSDTSLTNLFCLFLVTVLCWTPGCADDPSTIEDPAENSIQSAATLKVGDKCSSDTARACHSNTLRYCSSSGTVAELSCSASGSSCVSFADVPSYAACISDSDPTCTRHGKTRTECTRDETYHDEMSLTLICAKGSNGKYYEITQKKTYCSTLCSQGCSSKSCTGSSASCSGNTLQYCQNGQRYAVDCSAMGSTCIESYDADCQTWSD